MKKLLLLVVAILGVATAYSQAWEYRSGENKFDGFKWQVAGTVGTGEFPYTTPGFGVRKTNLDQDIEFLIVDGGPSSTRDVIKIIVDNGDVYEGWISTSTSSNTDFFIHLTDEEELSLIKEIKNGSTLKMRVYNSYKTYDMVFSLRGSTAAINKLGL